MSHCCLETRCIQCCKNTNMILSKQDIEAIQKLGYDAAFFVEEHNGWLQLKNAHGRCVFHNGDICTIYKHRPEGCTLYPLVWDADDACPMIDTDCPQNHCFSSTPQKHKQLSELIILLQKERTDRQNQAKQ